MAGSGPAGAGGRGGRGRGRTQGWRSGHGPGRRGRTRRRSGRSCRGPAAQRRRGRGSGGTGGGGTGGRGPNRIQVVAKCGQDRSSSSGRGHIKIYNLEACDKQWGDIKVRYYFTSDGTVPVVEFDYLANTFWNNEKTKLIITATGSYVEIGFNPTAGTLFAFDNIAGSGDIQMRIHPADYHSTGTIQAEMTIRSRRAPATAFMPRTTSRARTWASSHGERLLRGYENP